MEPTLQLRAVLLRSAWLGLLLAALAMSVQGSEPPPKEMTATCLAREVAARDRDLHRRYRYMTNGRQGIRGYGTAESNQSIVLEGSRQLVVLWHGFMASPPEMEPLGRALHEALGVSVYIPLIPGFGSGHRVADEFDLESWIRSVDEAGDLAAECSDRLAVVGYSVGGGLAVDQLVRGGAEAASRVRALVLLSPYVETAGWMMPGLRSGPRAASLRLLRSVLRMRSVSLERVDRVSRGRYRDLEILLQRPEIYDARFSLKAGLNMVRLTGRLRGLRADPKLATPTLTAISEADQTVSWRFTEEFLERNFAAAEPTIRYPREEEVAHQIVVPEVNPRFAELAEAVAEFLGRHLEAAD